MSDQTGRVAGLDRAGYERRARAAVVGAGLSTFWSGALVLGYPGIMRPVWAERFAASPASLGWIMTLVIVSLGVFTFVAGSVHARVVTRVSYLIGTAILVVAMVLVTYAQSLGLVYAWAFLNGTASCFVYGPSLATVQHWYPHRRGVVTGVVNLVFGLSAAIMAPLFQAMVTGLGYVAMGWLLIGAIVATNVVAALLTELPARTALTPAQRAAHAALLDAPADARAVPAPDVTPREALRRREFWFLWLTWCFMGAAGVSMVTLSSSYGLALAGRGVAVSGVVLLTVYNVANGLSRIVAGVLSDLVGRTVLASITFALAAVGYAILPATSHVVALGVAVALIGFAFGTLFAVTAPLGTDLFGLKHFGVIFGYVFTAYGFVGGLVGPLLSDVVLQATGSYPLVFGYLAVFCVLAAAFVLLARPCRA